MAKGIYYFVKCNNGAEKRLAFKRVHNKMKELKGRIIQAAWLESFGKNNERILVVLIK